MLYPHRTRVKHGTHLGHFCTYILALSLKKYKKIKIKKKMQEMAGHKSDTYFLLLFSFDFEHLSSYLLFTPLDLILWFAF